MWDFIGLIFIFAVIWGLYQFMKPKIAIGAQDLEPSLDRVALDKKNIEKMVIDVPDVLVIGK